MTSDYKPWVVIIERGESGIPMFMTDESGEPLRFATGREAREAVRGAMWEHAWVWWLVPLGENGVVRYGTDWTQRT